MINELNHREVIEVKSDVYEEHIDQAGNHELKHSTPSIHSVNSML